MSHIRSKDTELELSFRRYIWKKGIIGYRLHSKIKGKPDLYFPVKKIAVFIDGCFWHKCPQCFKKPKTKNEYWDIKIRNNTLRDKRINSILREDGIFVIRFWEHELKSNMDKCFQKLMSVYEEK
jgi:DNA mismatch endonuclease (patch repair protein)